MKVGKPSPHVEIFQANISNISVDFNKPKIDSKAEVTSSNDFQASSDCEVFNIDSALDNDDSPLLHKECSEIDKFNVSPVVPADSVENDLGLSLDKFESQIECQSEATSLEVSQAACANNKELQVGYQPEAISSDKVEPNYENDSEASLFSDSSIPLANENEPQLGNQAGAASLSDTNILDLDRIVPQSLGQSEREDPMALLLKNERGGEDRDGAKISSSSVMPANTVELSNMYIHSGLCTGSNHIWDPGGTSSFNWSF